MKFISTISILLFSTFLLAQETKPASAVKPGNFLTEIGQQVPAFEVESIDGVSISNKDLEGKIVLLNFWATWCGPCIREFPELNEFASKQDPELFQVMAFARGEDKMKVEKFRANNDYGFTFVSDLDKSVYSNFAEKSIPRNVVINAKGEIIFQLMGYYPEEIKKMEILIEEEIDKLK